MDPAPPHDAPLPLSRVLAEEGERLFSTPDTPFSARVAAQLARLRETQPPASSPDRPDAPSAAEREALACRAVRAAIHEMPTPPTALCCSGGGIRSATFNLGVIQALARLRMLDKFDYLSTVSGGGYIGGWLTAWIHRSTPAGARDAHEGVAAVMPQLDDLARDSTPARPTHEPSALRWLREYSNYLTPRLGFFSADSWTMIGIALRNLLLNWLVLLPILIVGFMIPRLQIAWVGQLEGLDAARAALCLGLLLTIPAMVYLHAFRPSYQSYRRPRAPHQSVEWDLERQNWFLVLSVLPLLTAAYSLTTAWAWYRNAHGVLDGASIAGHSAQATFTFVGLGLHLLGWLIAMLLLLMHSLANEQRLVVVPRLLRRMAKEMPVIAASGALGGFALWAVLNATPSTNEAPLVREFREWYAVFSVPGFLGLFLLVATFFIGLASRSTSDQDQEWWGRAGAWVLIAGTVAGTIGVLIVFGPGLLGKLGAWTTASIGGVSGLLSLVGGFSAKTLLQESTATDRLSRLRILAVNVATPLFVVLLVVLLAWVTSALVTGWTWIVEGPQGIAWTETGALMPEADPYQVSLHSLALHNATLPSLLTLWLALLGTGLFMGWFVNVNKFSLHGFYRNRLIRAYLGASRAEQRKPNRLTGFDEGDNVELRELANDLIRVPDRPLTLVPRTIQKPFHVVNIALNLVRGDNLAWQERKAQSFTATPLHCGSWQDLGYRSSEEYGYNQSVGRAITLGTAMATSGAAASPNMGYHSSVAVAFLLALFNIRLGWWLGNPGTAGGRSLLGDLGQTLRLRPPYKRACPGFSVGPLLAELFGMTTAKYRYVYLSDGGHFENLGLYEMVLRRCRHIVVVDAGCDPQMSFEDLGNAIRKIRIDLGVDITIDVEWLKTPNPADGLRRHHAIGTIHYGAVDPGAPPGTLVYLKASLTGDEPTDVQEYAAHHTAFPHEPTSDQFFDEAQFESYRRLGEHITWELFHRGLSGRQDASDQALSEVIARLAHTSSTPCDPACGISTEPRSPQSEGGLT